MAKKTYHIIYQSKIFVMQFSSIRIDFSTGEMIRDQMFFLLRARGALGESLGKYGFVAKTYKKHYALRHKHGFNLHLFGEPSKKAYFLSGHVR